MQNFWYWEKRVSVDQHLHCPLHCKIYITLGQTQTSMKFLQLFTCTRDEIISRSEICCHLHETCTRISCLNPPTKMKSDKSEFICRPVSCKRTVSCKYPTHNPPPKKTADHCATSMWIHREHWWRSGEIICFPPNVGRGSIPRSGVTCGLSLLVLYM